MMKNNGLIDITFYEVAGIGVSKGQLLVLGVYGDGSQWIVSGTN